MKSLVLAMGGHRARSTCPAGAAVKTIVIVHGAFSDASCGNPWPTSWNATGTRSALSRSP